MNSSILTLETWLIILEIIQLVKYLLKKGLNTLGEIKNAEIIKFKKCTPKHKELLNLFNNLLDTILIDKTLMSSKDENEKENGNKKENEKEKEKGKENEHDKTLMSSNDDNENKNENENDKTLMSSNDDNENKNENENDKTLITIKKLNDYLDDIIDKSKSFEPQIKSLRKVENIIEYCYYEDYGDKETCLYEMDPFYDFVIQPSFRRVDLSDAINLILNFNKAI